MVDEKKSERTVPEEQVPTNAATSFGLEDHEANQQDPRVEELQKNRSMHTRRSITLKTGPSTKTLTEAKTVKPVEASVAPSAPVSPPRTPAEPAGEAPNAATNYGLEDHKANQQDERVLHMRHPGNLKERAELSKPQPSKVNVVVASSAPAASQPAPEPGPAPALVATPRSSSRSPPSPATAATEPVTEPKPITKPASAPAAAPAPVPRLVFQPVETTNKRSSVPVPPPMPPTAPAARNQYQEDQARAKTSGVSKLTNTDVTFDPSKQFATKTTNTSGNLYTTDEDLPPPTQSKIAAISVFNMDDCFTFAVNLVKKAGAFALLSNQNRMSYTTKKHEHDLHTRTDNEVEEMIVLAIMEKYPNHKIIAEEAVSQSETSQVTLTNDPTWIIDPIDGTMNFVHHFPYYCISVALLVNKKTSFGIVFNPPLQECYTARMGQGAKLNGDPMQTSGQDLLKNAMILQEYSSGMHDDRTTVAMENAKNLIKKTHALRSIGSSAMGLAMVASGVADGFYFFGLHVWDMAAGNILVTEAGGTVIDPAGGPVDIMSRRVLAAATQPLALQLSAELTQNYPSPRDDQPRSVNPNEFENEKEKETEPEAEAEPRKKDFNAQTEFSESSFESINSDSTRASGHHTPHAPQ